MYTWSHRPYLTRDSRHLISCVPQQPVLATHPPTIPPAVCFALQTGYYDRSRDISLLRAYRQCAAREIQWNATLCQSTVLTAY
jgi:hypothetical protein